MVKKQVKVTHGIILGDSRDDAARQFNVFCKGTRESAMNRCGVWFVKRCKSSPVPGTFTSWVGKPLSELPRSVFDAAEFVIANGRYHDQKAKKYVRTACPGLLAWTVAATSEHDADPDFDEEE